MASLQVTFPNTGRMTKLNANEKSVKKTEQDAFVDLSFVSPAHCQCIHSNWRTNSVFKIGLIFSSQLFKGVVHFKQKLWLIIYSPMSSNMSLSFLIFSMDINGNQTVQGPN